jgi:LemA protein
MNMLLVLIFTGIIVAVVVIATIFIWYVATMNSLRRTEIKVQESLSDIDVALMKRHDVLMKMLDISKSFAQFEKDTMLETIRLRSGMSINERNQATEAMDHASHILQAVAENYPELRSNENFKQLQLSVMDVEEHLQAARRLYNGNVSNLNQKIVSFPSSIVANRLHITQIEFLEAEAEKRQDIKMNLL